MPRVKTKVTEWFPSSLATRSRWWPSSVLPFSSWMTATWMPFTLMSALNGSNSSGGRSGRSWYFGLPFGIERLPFPLAATVPRRCCPFRENTIGFSFATSVPLPRFQGNRPFFSCYWRACDRKWAHLTRQSPWVCGTERSGWLEPQSPSFGRPCREASSRFIVVGCNLPCCRQCGKIRTHFVSSRFRLNLRRFARCLRQ